MSSSTRSAARRGCARPRYAAVERRHRAGEQQRDERRLLPHEGDDDAAPVEQALRGQRLDQPEPISTWFSIPFLARNVRMIWPVTMNGMNSGQR